MAFQFKAGETLEEGVRRIARGQIDKALNALTGRTDARRKKSSTTSASGSRRSGR